MKKIFQLTSILAAVSLLALSCTPEELSTDQYSSTAVVLQAYGPQPVVRGGTLRFIGSNLDQVKTVVIPENNQITDIQVINAGAHSEIRVTVPKETAAVGYPKLVLADGTEIVGKTLLEYSEPITIDELTPAAAYPGEVITFKGDYLNLIHEVVFNNKVVVSEDKFASHTRYEIKVAVPATARTGVVALGTVDETKVDASSAEGKSLLATLNLVSPENEFTVKTADGKAVAGTYKPGAEVTVNGTRLDLVKSVLLEGASPEAFNATASKITFAMPAGAKTGNVTLVMESGVEVNAGTITSAQPSGLAAAPAPVKNGAQLTITGADLDLVTGIDLPNASGTEFALADGKITLTVGENAQEGDITLWMANGLNVAVAYTLVKPTVTGFSANPASAGSDVTVEGTDLDLVAAVTFGGGTKVEVEAGADSFTVAVPTAAETAVLVLNLKNGTDIETIELAIDKPAGAYIANMPEDLYSPGQMFIIDIENADHLTGVQVDGADVTFILNGSTLYFQIPDNAKADSQLTLVSDNGSVTYTMNIDPGDFIVTPIWTAGFDCSGWNGNQDLAWGGYDWSTVAPGMILRFELESTKAPGDWWCISLRHGDSWGALAGVPGQYDTPESPLDIVLTQEILDDLVASNGLVITGDGYHLSRICLVQDLRYGDTIWNGPFTCDGWNGDQSLAWGGYDWSTVKAGQTLFFHLTPTVADGDWWCISLRHGDSWGALAGVPGQYDSPESPLGVVLTQEIIDDLVACNGLVVTGTGYILEKISLK